MISPTMRRELAKATVRAQMASSLRETARAALKGMLAHPTRYTPRAQDSNLHWHDAIAREACDIAEALLSEVDRRTHGTAQENQHE